MQLHKTSIALLSFFTLLSLLASTVSAQTTTQEDIVTYFTPFDEGAGHLHYIQMLDTTKEKIRMNAYGFTDPDVCTALVAAKKRGVDVAVTMDGTEAAGPHQAPFVQQLKDAGVDVLIGKSPKHSQLLHAKITICDDSRVEEGSWNYSPSASDQFNTITFTNSKTRAAAFTGAWQKIHDHLMVAGHKH